MAAPEEETSLRSEPAPLLLQHGQQTLEEEEEEEASVSGRRRPSLSHIGVAALAAGALLVCYVFAAPRTPGQLVSPSALGDVVGGVMELRSEGLEDRIVEPIRMALAGEPKPPPGEPQRYVVFRCRGRDYAGGFGDRLAGLFGAAYLALSMRRQLKVDWPELYEAFLPNQVDLRYNGDELGITRADQEILEANHFGSTPNFPDWSFAGLSPDVAVFNAWEVDVWYSDHWRKYPSDVSEGAKEFRVLIMGGNRGGTREWFEALKNDLKVVPVDCTFWKLYHILFATMLRPNPAFMQQPVLVQVASTLRPVYDISIPMTNAVKVLTSPDTYSMAVHIRAGDEVYRRETGFGNAGADICEGVDPVSAHGPRLDCIVNLARQLKASTSKKKVLVIFSDSRCVKKHITDYFLNLDVFEEVWSQEISGTVNIDTTLQVVDQDDEQHAWQQSMRDWMLMQHVNTFAVATHYTFFSGFPASALATTSVDKELYSLATCEQLDKNAICADRFC